MTNEDTNLADAGSASLDPSTSLDNPDNWNFADPDEDGEIDETQPEGNEGEQAEPTETEGEEEAEQSKQDDDEADAEDGSQEEPETEEAEAEKPATIRLPTGEDLPLEEIVGGYMKGADYTQKTQKLSESQRELTAKAELVSSQVDALAEFITSNLPPEPDANLAYTDASTFMAQKAVYDQQLAQVANLLSIKEPAQKVVQEINQSDIDSRRNEENAALVARFPQTATETGRKEFFAQAADAAKQLGLTDTEINGTMDHRIFAMAHYAALGLKAEEAKKTAKRKVAAAPKAAPVKQRKAPANRDAMKRLSQSGSMADALLVDFE